MKFKNITGEDKTLKECHAMSDVKHEAYICFKILGSDVNFVRDGKNKEKCFIQAKLSASVENFKIHQEGHAVAE